MLVTLDCGKVIKVIFSFLVRGAQQNHFWLKLGFCPNKGGRGLTQSQLFKTKITTIQNGDFVGILSHYGRGGGPYSQAKQITKNHQSQKRDFS